MKILIGSFLFLILSLSVLSQTISCSVDRYLQSVYSTNIIPGFSVVVIKDHKQVFSKGYGQEKTGLNKPFTTASVIAIGSLTKSFTALAVMKLVEKGKIGLDEPVIKYIPSFRTANKEQSDKITIRMLLNNTSGLYSPNTSPTYDLTEGAIETFVKNLSSIFLTKQPGNSYEYSNAGFVVAGFVISKVSGISYASYLENEIFKPLGMSRTSTKPEALESMNIVQGHYASIKSSIVAKRESEFSSVEFAPAGSILHSCADDLGKYLIALTSKNAVVDETLKKALWTSNINFPGLTKEDGGDGEPFSYGLGWMISTIEGRKIIHHGGSTGKTSSFTMIDTLNKVAATILFNLDMTFIDKYTYATEFNILNNVLRLETDLKVSSFGRPLIKDPTLNNYELNQKNRSNYTGGYRFKKGGDTFVYFGVDLKIKRTADGQLVGIIYRGDQVVNSFILDFVNESLAVSRNINMPDYIKFKITPVGKVSSAYYKGIEFSKNENEHLFKEYTDIYGAVNLKLPQIWKCNFGKFSFSAIDGNNAFLSGGRLSNVKFSLDTIFNSFCLPSMSLIDESPILSYTIGTFIWQQKTYVYKKGNENFESMMIFTKDAKHCYWFFLSSSKRDFTANIQQVINPLIQSFRVK